MNHIPSLQANYTPVPTSFLRLAFSGAATREELIVLLYLFSKTYGWKPEKGFVSLQDITHEAGLSEEEASRGLGLALDHDQVLEMPLDPHNPEAPSMYLLHTLENRRFLEAYASASSDSHEAPVHLPDPGEGPADRHAARGAPPLPPPSPAPEAMPGSMLSPDDMPVVEEETDAPMVPESPPPLEGPDEGPGEGPDEGRERPEAGLGEGSGADPFADWGLGSRTAEMVIRLLGRVPTKDERLRLEDSGSSDTELIEAMGRLLEKKVDVYSSDLILYEVEAMKTAERRQRRETELKAAREARMERQRGCTRCDGLGYFFVGVSGIQECECRKAAGA